MKTLDYNNNYITFNMNLNVGTRDWELDFSGRPDLYQVFITDDEGMHRTRCRKIYIDWKIDIKSVFPSYHCL